jgi:hypothetical protein
MKQTTPTTTNAGKPGDASATNPKAPPPREAPPLDLDAPNSHRPPPHDVGTAQMLEDGTLSLRLRTETADGTIGEALMIVAPGDARYAGMVTHLGGMKTGESRSIPPFVEPQIDPDSV